MFRAMLIGLAVVAGIDAVSAAKLLSGNDIQAGCRRFAIESNVRSGVEALDNGICMGLVIGVLQTSPAYDPAIKFCAPATINMGQGVKVLSKFLSDNPAALHLDAGLLAIRAFREAWPCGELAPATKTR